MSRRIYIAGLSLNIPEWAYVSHNQGMETISAAATLYAIGYTVSYNKKAWKHAQEKGGKIKRTTTTTIGKLVTPIHACAIIITPTLYLASVLTNGMYQADWFAETTGFPIKADLAVGIAGKSILRAVASVGIIAHVHLMEATVKTLGVQFHPIGVRENGQVVSTGPYQYVRHPLYTLLLGTLGCMSVAYWSWLPLVTMVIAGGAFAVKIPIEEKLIEDEGPAYAAYKTKVQFRLIPYVW